MSLYTEVIVSYDVEDNKKRKKLFDALKDHGLVDIQKSVFWGRVLPAEKKAIYALFDKLLNKETDKAFIADIKLAEQIKAGSFGYGDGSLFKERNYIIL